MTNRYEIVLAVPLLALCVGAFGCQKESSRLTGSVGKLYDLSYDHARARLYSSQFAVEYVREDGQVPVRVVLDRGDKPLQAKTYDLTTRGGVTGRVDEQRLPPLDGGTITLRQVSESPDGRIEGRFDARLKAGDSTFTVQGQYDTSLEVVDGSLGYSFPDVGADAADVGDAGEVGAEAGRASETSE